MRIALGGITHEANTFCPHVTDMADFEVEKEMYGLSLNKEKQSEVLETWLTQLAEGRVEYTDRWKDFVEPEDDAKKD